MAALSAKQDAQQISESKNVESVARSPLTKALTEGSMKRQMEADAERMSRDKFCAKYGDEYSEFWDNISGELSEADYSAKKAAAGKDIGKPGKNFAKIAAKSGGGEKGKRIAGAVLNKLRHPTEEGVDKEAFAKLAPPADKITYADKIAGAKKASGKKITREADPVSLEEMLTDEGNEFTDARLAAIKSGQRSFKIDGKTYRVTGDTSDEKQMDEGWADMDAWLKSREKEKGTGRFDKKKISTGTVYTRKPETFASDEEETSSEPKRVGRPKGKAKGPERTTKGAWKHKGERKVAEEMPLGATAADAGEYGNEGDMAKDDIHTIVRHAQALEKILGDNENLPEWVQSKLAKIQGMMVAVDDYMQTQHERGAEKEISEKAVSKKQQKFMGMVHATQKGEKPASKEVSKVAKTMKKKDAEDFASTKHKGLPEKVKETTTSGSVATAPAKAPKAAKGMQFGKGVYESINSSVEQIISESMNVTVNMSTDDNGQPHKNVTVTADGADADTLAQLLKMAGLGGQSAQETCPTCGSAECGCGEQMVDENSPDYPTNTETLPADPELRTYSSGLNGPKSTGQTTIPVVASQQRRLVSMEENVQLERSLFKTCQNYKG